MIVARMPKIAHVRRYFISRENFLMPDGCLKEFFHAFAI